MLPSLLVGELLERAALSELEDLQAAPDAFDGLSSLLRFPLQRFSHDLRGYGPDRLPLLHRLLVQSALRVGA